MQLLLDFRVEGRRLVIILIIPRQESILKDRWKAFLGKKSQEEKDKTHRVNVDGLLYVGAI